jgi:hypothetical protein
VEEMERIEEIKQRLERNKKWQTQTENGYVPSIVGEYKHDDVEWLIDELEKVKTDSAYWIKGLEEERKELKSLCLWSARRLKHPQYKDFAYDEYEKITSENPERL